MQIKTLESNHFNLNKISLLTIILLSSISIDTEFIVDILFSK